MGMLAPPAAVIDSSLVCALDGMPALTSGAAYSVNERLLSSYTGPLFTVRRASDNATLDVYWTSRNHCDEAALVAFCGASVGSVTTLYDQSGFSRDLTQATAANQPTVYTGSAVQKEGANVALLFGSSQLLARVDALGLSGSPAFTAITSQNISQSAVSQRIFWALGTSASNSQYWVGTLSGAYNVGAAGAVVNSYGTASTAFAYLTTQHATAAGCDQCLVRENGVAKALITAASQAPLITATSFALGNWYSAGYQIGTLSTAVFLPYTLTSQQQTNIEAWLEARRTGVEWTAQLTRLAAVIEPARVYPLDAFTSVLASAWSVAERVVATWAGPLFTVRRASDNTAKDIGYDSSGFCDTATLAAFCSGTSGFVTKVYDQSGNARDISQATAANQPTIYASGAVQRDGANVSMLFASAQVLTRADAVGFSGNPSLTSGSLHNFANSSNAARVLWILGPNTNSTTLLFAYASGAQLQLYAPGVSDARFGTAASALSYLIAQHASGANNTTFAVRENGATKGLSGANGDGALPIANTSMSVGGDGSSPVGSLSTLFFLTTTLTAAQLAAVELWLEARRTSKPWQANAGSGIGRITTEAIARTPAALNYAATLYIDLAARAVSVVKLTGPASIAPVNPVVGYEGRILIAQDSTGGRALSWVAPTGWTLAWLTPLQLTLSPNAIVAYDYQCVTISGANYILLSATARVDSSVRGCPFDTLPLAAGLYSVNEQLVSSYTGPLFNVRRSLWDAAQTDIGFVPATGLCDEAALATACFGTAGYVTKIYDQSGNGRHLLQVTAANQPLIYTGSATQKDGGNVAMLFAANQVLTRSDALGFAGSAALTAISLHNFLTTGAVRCVYELGPESGGSTFAVYQNTASSANSLAVANFGTETRYGVASAVVTAYLVVQHAAGASLGNCSVRENAVVKPYTNNVGGTVSDPVAIGNTAMALGNFVGYANACGSLSTAGFLPYTLNEAQTALLETWLEARRVGADWISPQLPTATARVTGLMPFTEKSRLELMRGCPLDNIPSNAAWSVSERLYSKWTGPLFKVQRASDGAQLDIGCNSSGACDEVSLAAFCASTTGYLITLYDQSGNGRDLQYYSSAPIVVTAGVVRKDGNYVTAWYDTPCMMSRGDTCGVIGTQSFACLVAYNPMPTTAANYTGVFMILGSGPTNPPSSVTFQYGFTGVIPNAMAIDIWGTSSFVYSGGAPVNAPSYLTFQRPAGADFIGSTLRLNGMLRVPSTGWGWTAVSNFQNDSTQLGAGSHSPGNVSTAVIFGTTLTPIQLAVVEEWLEARRVNASSNTLAPVLAASSLAYSASFCAARIVPYAAAITFDMSASNDGAVDVLKGNTTITFSNVARGRTGTIWVKQDATGGRTVTFAASGWTVVRDTLCADLVAASGANTLTEYKYATFTIGTTGYIRILKSALV